MLYRARGAELVKSPSVIARSQSRMFGCRESFSGEIRLKDSEGMTE